MTKEEFERGYCERSDITHEYYAAHFVTLPCSCEEEGCDGWACISNNTLSIKAHNRNWTDNWDKMMQEDHGFAGLFDNK